MVKPKEYPLIKTKKQEGEKKKQFEKDKVCPKVLLVLHVGIILDFPDCITGLLWHQAYM